MTISYELNFSGEVDDRIREPEYLKALLSRAVGIDAAEISVINVTKDTNTENKKRSFQKCSSPQIGKAWMDRFVSGFIDKDIKREILDQEMLRERLLKRAEMLDAAQPIVKVVIEYVRDYVSNYVLMIADEDGYLLSNHLSPELAQKSKELYLVPGARYLVDNVGHNGIGAALKLREPVVVSGDEHSKKTFHTWTCISTPLYDANREIKGVFALAVPVEQALSRFYDLIIEAGRCIENHIQKTYFRNKYQLKLAMYSELSSKFDLILNKIEKGIIILNSDDCVVACNNSALEIVGMSRDCIMGQKIIRIFSKMQEKIRIIKNSIEDEESSDMELIVLNGKSRSVEVAVDAEVIYDNKGRPLGSIITFEETRESPEPYASAVNQEVNGKEEIKGLRSNFYKINKCLRESGLISNVNGTNIRVRWKIIRLRWNLEKKEFAEQVLGLNPNQYYRYEKGTSFPTLPKTLLMASKLNCLVEEIYSVDDNS